MTFSTETKEKIILDMCNMIKCETISHRDDKLVNWNEYEKFQQLLKDSYPTIYQKCGPVVTGEI